MVQTQNEPPQERAPLLRVFGALAPRVAGLIRARPGLVARLIVAPPEAIHAAGAYLHLAPGAARPDAEVAATIDDSDPRDLLRAALPGCPPRLYRAFERAGDGVRERAYYEKVGEVVRGPFGDAFLDGDALLGDHRLDHYRALGTMDPLAASVRHALPDGSTHHLECVETLVAFLEAHGALRDGDLDLPPKAGTTAVAKRLRRALGRIRAPDPGFRVPPPYRLVESAAELHRIGREFQNCVAGPDWQANRAHLGLLQGTEAFLVSDDPQVLVAMRRAAAGVWVFEQMAGPRNGPAPEGAREALLRGLAAAGVRVVPVDPATALSRLEQDLINARNRALQGGGDLPIEGDDDEVALRDAA
jgi:hypothetical protein